MDTNCRRIMCIKIEAGGGSSTGYEQQVGPMVVIIKENKQALAFQKF